MFVQQKITNKIMFSLYILLACITALFLRYLLRLLLPRPRVADFGSKYVFITGCDSGFGKMTAIRLDQMGFLVIAACLTERGKDDIREMCSDRLISVSLDVTNSKQIQDVAYKVKELVGDKGIWALVNNAGVMTNGPIEWFHIDDFKRMADVNLWGVIEVTQMLLPLIKKAKGRVVNLASMAGFCSSFSLAPYSVTKYGVEGFSDALRREMVDYNVKVSIIEPEAFKTQLVEGIWGEKLDALWDRLDDEKKSEYDLEKVRKRIKKIFTAALNDNPSLVVDAITDAVTSSDPSPRYLIGFTAKLVALTCLLPTRAQDFVLSMEDAIGKMLVTIGVR